ncbi:phage holin family protein [Limisalsivibrio acetivorans]|uniref:phage holin family protein n=1 Tax=Limisalsivibrio acetivorans TaxID=1304888 RepID=UPI0003B6AF91|nr:phage holin family protein [Limisalsivibrio acetivorans]
MNDGSYIVYRILANLVGLAAAGFLIPGFDTGTFMNLIGAALILTFLHIFVRPIVVFLTLPLQVLTVGILYLIINTFFVMIAADLAGDMYIKGFFSALFAALIISFVNVLLDGYASANRLDRIQ